MRSQGQACARGTSWVIPPIFGITSTSAATAFFIIGLGWAATPAILTSIAIGYGVYGSAKLGMKGIEAICDEKNENYSDIQSTV